MSRVVLFCFDLTLPEDFVPTAEDGEVESFFTWGLGEIGRSMDPGCRDPIKPNCYLGEHYERGDLSIALPFLA